MAIILQDERVREAIRQEAMKRKDKGYIILASQFGQVTISASETLSEKLIHAYSELFSKDVESVEIRLTSLIETVPQLQVSIPLFCESWDIKTFVPAIACENYSRNYPQNRMVAYDSEGGKHFISFSEEPLNPTLVLGYSELFDSEGNERIQNTLILNQDIDFPSSSRVDGQAFGLRIIYSSATWAQLDESGWFNNTAEFAFHIHAPKLWAEPIATVFTTMTKSQVKNNEWKCVLTDYFNWSYGTYGDVLIVQVYETDGGGKQTYSIEYQDPNTNTTYTSGGEYEDNDDDMGRLPIMNTDIDWQVYNTGKIVWYLTGTHSGGYTCN
ncbi:MAG: hypothetical protein R3D00_01425 [Bacteroidia bacterium]